jgi:2-C-methyl-D-erythritol 4-phosphate cytidylyltransferase
MEQKYVLITAAGAGVRMNSPLPKQFMELQGKPVLFHTISRFIQFSLGIKIILVLPQQQIAYWNELCDTYRFRVPLSVVAGGPTRFHSVKNGLTKVPNDAIVAIHDGVRPLVSMETIKQAFHYASLFGNAIPAIGVSESVRVMERSVSKIIDRNSLRIIQTPQCFKASLIKKAYGVNFMESFTDDASVLEYSGERIFIVDGNRENIKITSQEDFVIASALMGHQSL